MVWVLPGEGERDAPGQIAVEAAEGEIGVKVPTVPHICQVHVVRGSRTSNLIKS